MGILSELLQVWERTDLLDRILEEGEAGVPGAARPLVVAGLVQRTAPALVVLPRSREAESFAVSLEPWLPTRREGGMLQGVALYPAWEVLPGEAMSPTLDTMGRRIRVATHLASGTGPAVIVTSVRGFLQRICKPDASSIRLAPGISASLEELSERLVDFGFERNYLVERPGEFSVRGGILDMYPAGRSNPVRAELFGDEITSLREFSVSSQRSRGGLDGVEVQPVKELRLSPDVRHRAVGLLARCDPAEQERCGDLERLAAGIEFPGMEAYLGALGGPLQPLSELLPPTGCVVVLDPKQCRDRTADFLAQAAEWATSPRAPGSVPPGEGTSRAGEAGGSHANMFAGFDQAVGGAATLELWPYARGEEGIDLDATGWDQFTGRPDRLADALRRHGSEGSIVAVAAGSSAARARDVLAEAGLGLPLLRTDGSRENAAGGFVCDAPVENGFLLRLEGVPTLALLGSGDLFGKHRPSRGSTLEAPARASALLLELAQGDYVVHELYGVGRYEGMVTRDVAGISRDYLLIAYQGDDRLYVPTEQLEAVTKYTGGESPKLNKLGTGEWERAKSRARRAVADIVDELVALYSKRHEAVGHAFSPDTPWQRQLEGAFPYVETPDQARAIDEVKADMERPLPMDRLICGDVGYGKTEIAVRAAFKAIQDSKQVAVLVPTTILAQQHTQTFGERFAGFPVRVSQLSRFLTDRQAAEVLEGLATGKVDAVIGTHRLLQRDVKFHDLGLLVVDEEQRFGVRHKEAIKRLREQVDVITMSATPIPRTLEMGLTGIRDLSLVDTPPVDRRPVLTYVGPYDERMVTSAIRRELARDGQVFFVHNRVRSIRAAARRTAGLVPGARIEIAHGQMSEGELERVMIDVWDGKIDVLVCTTIIESGLDIPAMNTLIVDRADRLGLAQLYQLRGRVGRARERAYAYFFYRDDAALSVEGHERLKTLSEFTELGSGFKIALRDLEIRGSGNLLGAEQSGHIAAVGFDLYLKMMKEAVAALSGEQDKKLDVRIELPVDAFIPASYIGRETLRMEAYRQIERVRSEQEARDLREELQDRYGPLPPPLESLLIVAELRLFLASHGVSEATVRQGVLKLRPFPDLLDSQEVRLRRTLPRAAFKSTTRTLLMPVPAENLAAWVLDTVRAILA